MKSISSKPISIARYIKLVWEYKYLVLVVAKRDIKTTYAQTKMRALWFFIQPLVWLLIFSIFFGKVAIIDVGEVPRPIFLFAGITVWFYFTGIIHSSAHALDENALLIKQVYFPKLVLLISKLFSVSFSGLVNMLILVLLLIYHNLSITWHIMFMPVIMAATAFCALTCTLWMTALSHRYKDLNHAVPMLVGFAIWLTPVFYPSSLVPEPFGNYISSLNPIGTLIELMRWSAYGGTFPEASSFISLGVMVIMFITGLLVFRRNERYFAERI